MVTLLAIGKPAMSISRFLESSLFKALLQEDSEFLTFTVVGDQKPIVGIPPENPGIYLVDRLVTPVTRSDMWGISPHHVTYNYKNYISLPCLKNKPLPQGRGDWRRRPARHWTMIINCNQN